MICVLCKKKAGQLQMVQLPGKRIRVAKKAPSQMSY